MVTLVIGGAASGKSEFAEELVMAAGDQPRYYIATMQPFDQECRARICRHREMRAKKRFETVECFLNLEQVTLPRRGVVLLECMSNLVANELYSPDGAGDQCEESVRRGIRHLRGQCKELVIVSNEVFSGGSSYEGDTKRYLQVLARVNRLLAQEADRVYEVVCGIPVCHKGGGKSMMNVFQTIAVAFAMFSAIPCPQPVWTEKNMRYSLCAFPLIGVVCGLLWWGWSALMAYVGAPTLLLAGGMCAIPVLVTGGIHLDGYADTSDALGSYGPPEKKREILKDPRCGAFAVIRLCTWFALYFALCGSVRWDSRALWCMGLAFVLERCLSGFANAAFPLAKNTGLAHTFAAAADKKKVRTVLAVASVVLAVAMILVGGLAGVAMVVAAGWVLWRYHRVALKQFGGITGDLAGWFLQRAELWMLGALAAIQLLEGMKWFL